MSSKDVSAENFVIVQFVQAMIGLVSSRLRAVAIQLNGSEVLARFLYDVVQPSDREDVEDICFELDVLLEGKHRIISEVKEAIPISEWEGKNERRIYLAKTDKD